jgi:hypothetical protein
LTAPPAPPGSLRRCPRASRRRGLGKDSTGPTGLARRAGFRKSILPGSISARPAGALIVARLGASQAGHRSMPPFVVRPSPARVRHTRVVLPEHLQSGRSVQFRPGPSVGSGEPHRGRPGGRARTGGLLFSAHAPAGSKGLLPNAPKSRPYGRPEAHLEAKRPRPRPPLCVVSDPAGRDWRRERRIPTIRLGIRGICHELRS